VLTICGCYAAGNQITRQARQQQQHYLPQLGWTAAAFPATPAAWFYSELSWWGLKSSLPLNVAYTHCGSLYSVKSLYQQGVVAANHQGHTACCGKVCFEACLPPVPAAARTSLQHTGNINLWPRQQPGIPQYFRCTSCLPALFLMVF
jgi:hypothetical protein